MLTYFVQVNCITSKWPINVKFCPKKIFSFSSTFALSIASLWKTSLTINFLKLPLVIIFHFITNCVWIYTHTHKIRTLSFVVVHYQENERDFRNKFYSLSGILSFSIFFQLFKRFVFKLTTLLKVFTVIIFEREKIVKINAKFFQNLSILVQRMKDKLVLKSSIYDNAHFNISRKQLVSALHSASALCQCCRLRITTGWRENHSNL